MSENINPEQLKAAMRAWVTGVAIVTGHHKGAFHGMTANSFTSIALSPPTVMVALQQDTRTQHVVNASGVFAVTILDINQLTLAKRFAGQVDDEKSRFDGVETFLLVTGSPLIKNGIAFLDCKVVDSFNIGGTTVFLGEVLATKNEPRFKRPLLYHNQQWGKLEE